MLYKIILIFGRVDGINGSRASKLEENFDQDECYFNDYNYL